MQVVGVNFQKAGKVYDYLTGGLDIKKGDKVIVDTPKGLELAYVVTNIREVEEKQDMAKVVRIASQKDIEKVEKMYEKQDSVRATVEECVKNLGLELKIVSVDFPFEGNKIVVSFVSDDRVDFRDLVKDLAQKLKSRIELKQIGVRDQVKEIGSIGVCGKECCCREYLSDFDKVSIKMAKNQGLSLTPSKISGMCGRLMCCLAFEDEYYQEMSKKMPKVGSVIKTPSGEGTVYYNDLLRERVTIKMMVNDMPKLVTHTLAELTVGVKKESETKLDTSKVEKTSNQVQKQENKEKQDNRHKSKHKKKKH